MDEKQLQAITLKLMAPLYKWDVWRVAKGNDGYIRFRLEDDGGFKFDTEEENKKLTGQINKRGYVTHLDVRVGTGTRRDDPPYEGWSDSNHSFPQ